MHGRGRTSLASFRCGPSLTRNAKLELGNRGVGGFSALTFGQLQSMVKAWGDRCMLLLAWTTWPNFACGRRAGVFFFACRRRFPRAWAQARERGWGTCCLRRLRPKWPWVIPSSTFGVGEHSCATYFEVHQVLIVFFWGPWARETKLLGLDRMGRFSQRASEQFVRRELQRQHA